MPDLKRTRIATQIIFLVCGFGISAWAPMVPYVKDRLQLNESEIGLLLLFLGAGALTMMPVTGWVLLRSGTRKVILFSSLLLVITLPLLLIMPDTITMAVMLFLFGAAIGSLDVAINTHGVYVQNVSPRPIMSSLHGLYSVGGLFGPLVMGILLTFGFTPAMAAAVVSLILILLTAFNINFLFSSSFEKTLHKKGSGDQDTSGNRRWNSTMIFLGLLCFAAFLSEGAMLDWGALFLRDVKGMEDALAGWGFALFSIAMAIMRLSGDRVVDRAGPIAVVTAGSTIGAAGIAVIVLAPWIWLSLCGFVLLGLGAANVVPVLFSEGGRLNNPVAIPVITTLGYGGQLAGPALLGVIAEYFTLSAAIGITGFLFLMVGIAFRIRGTKNSEV